MGARRGNTHVTSVRGATVAFEPFHRASVAAIQVWIGAGAAHEGPSERGVAHFLEHMLFQNRLAQFGSVGLGTLVEEVGGTVNAWTSQDYTVVHLSVPAESFEQACRALLQNVLALELDEAAVERERNVILQEIAREEENPGLSCMRTLFEERYAGHVYGRRVIGTASSVSALKASDIKRFHARYYAPALLTIAVVGDLSERLVLEVIDRELQTFEREVGPVQAVPLAGRGRQGLRAVVRDVAEAHFAIGFPIPALRHPDVPALDCASLVLGETKGAILEVWRQAYGLVNEISSMSYTPMHGGTFGLHGATNPGRLLEALSGLAQQVREFVATGPDLAAMGAVREHITSSAYRVEETAHGRAGRLGYELAAAGEVGFFRRYMSRVMALEAEEVRRVLQRYIGRVEPCVVVVAPEGAICESLPKFTVRRAVAVPGFSEPTRTVLPSGMVLLHWRDRTHPTVVVRIQAPGGLEFETEETNGLYSLLSRLYMCGAGGRPASAVMREFDALGAEFGVVSGYSAVSATLDAPVGKLMPAFALAVECLTRPNLAQGDIEREKALLVEEIRTRVDRPASLLNRELLARLFAQHPYGLDPAGRREALERLRRDDLADAAARLLDPAGLVVGVVGDCDAMEVAAMLGADSRVGRRAREVPEPAPVSFAVTIAGPFRQSHVGMAWHGVALGSPHRLAVAVFAEALGLMSGPLFQVLRDRLGIAYSMGFASNVMPLAGWLKASAAVRPGTEEVARGAIRDVIADVLAGGPQARELMRRGATHLAGSMEMAFQKKAAVAAWMCANEGTPLGFDSFRTVARLARQVEPEEAIEAARPLVSREPLTVTLVPEEKV